MLDHYRISADTTWIALVLALVLTGCAPSAVTLSRLVTDQERYVGDWVTVTGKVVSFEEPDGTESFGLEDTEQNRVLLLPSRIGESHVGQLVEVTGRFEFEPGLGRTLWVEEIRPQHEPGGG